MFDHISRQYLIALSINLFNVLIFPVITVCLANFWTVLISKKLHGFDSGSDAETQIRLRPETDKYERWEESWHTLTPADKKNSVAHLLQTLWVSLDLGRFREGCPLSYPLSEENSNYQLAINIGYVY